MAGRFKVILERRVHTQNATGEAVYSYVVIDEVYADIRALSGREFFAAQQINAEITTEITIRYMRGINSTCRVRHLVEHDSPQEYDVYDIVAVLPDAKTGRRELKLMCVLRETEGWRTDGSVATGDGELPPATGFTIPWSQITDVPSEFPPAAHTHDAGDISGIFADEQISETAVTQHTGALVIDWSQLTNVPPISVDVEWDDILNKPSTFPPSSHMHDWDDLQNVPSDFPPSAHVHDHGALDGLTEDDHKQYLLATGSRALTGTQTTRALVPDTDSTRELGEAATRYRKVYAGAAQIASGDGEIISTNGSVLGGVSEGSGSKLGADSQGAVVIGMAQSNGGVAEVLAQNQGAVAIGMAVDVFGSGTGKILSNGMGSFASGLVEAWSEAATMEATSSGSIALGYASEIFGGATRITSSGLGSTVLGAAVNGTLEATAEGAHAVGSSNGGVLSASGVGSIAMGYAGSGRTLEATAAGAIALGSSSSADVVASAENAVQFGPGINAVANSMRVGNAGLHLKGTVGAFSALANGQIWVDASGIVNIRSGGNTVQIV